MQLKLTINPPLVTYVLPASHIPNIPRICALFHCSLLVCSPAVVRKQYQVTALTSRQRFSETASSRPAGAPCSTSKRRVFKAPPRSCRQCAKGIFSCSIRRYPRITINFQRLLSRTPSIRHKPWGLHWEEYRLILCVATLSPHPSSW